VVGYGGGSTPHPSYRSMGDHTEIVQVEYDPTVTSFPKLLDFFWSHHDPNSPKACSRQYMSAIFYHSEEQRVEAMVSLERRRREGQVSTRVLPLHQLVVAEEYHQKYLLQREGWLLAQLDIEPGELVRSNKAARLNNYIAGFGDQESFDAELCSLDISKRAADFVIKKIKEQQQKK